MTSPLITIFTATYNRSKYLLRLYESILRQKYYNFEWIIIDDDSVDDTEKLVKELILIDNSFPVYYYKQPHGGKHRAINYGLKVAKGKYFFIVDSDDYLTDDAIEYITKWINDCGERPYLAGVAGCRKNSAGLILGQFPSSLGLEWIEASNLERTKYYLEGDKAEILKLDILKDHPFPEFENEYFVTENICWNAIAAEGYKIRWYSHTIYVTEYLDDGLSKSGANGIKGKRENFQAFCYYIIQCIHIKKKLDWIADFRDYYRTCKVLHLNIHERIKGLNVSILTYTRYVILTIILYPIRIIRKIIWSIER